MDKAKLYCYVDENGQDTLGRIFIVSVVVIEKEIDETLLICEQYEKESGKDKLKWGKAESKRRLDYLQRVFNDKRFKGKLRYSVFENSKSYDQITITGIAKAINWEIPVQSYTTAIYIDGLSKIKRHEYSSKLRKLGIHTSKVQGVTKDENNALVRLADAVAGFVRDVLDGQGGEMKKIFEEAIGSKVLIAVSEISN